MVTCEHASREIPPGFDHLGLGEDVLSSHVAWDPGAEEVATQLAAAFDLPLTLGEQSRLVADLNRSPENADSVPAHAFGVDVPGNTGLDAAAIAARLATYHTPYWDKVARDVEAALSGAAVRVLHVSVHSFVEEYRGARRDVDLGLLFDPDRPLELEHATALREMLAGSGLDVRFNEPYDGRSDGLTTAFRKRYPAERYVTLELEINQRHLADIARVADLVTGAYRRLGLFSEPPSTLP